MEKQGKLTPREVTMYALGIEYYEKNVSNQLIEFMNYYISETV
jgi:hypothetical protein